MQSRITYHPLLLSPTPHPPLPPHGDFRFGTCVSDIVNLVRLLVRSHLLGFILAMGLISLSSLKLDGIRAN